MKKTTYLEKQAIKREEAAVRNKAMRNTVYQTELGNIASLMAQIEEKIECIDPEPEDVNWAEIGELQRVKMALIELHTILNK